MRDKRDTTPHNGIDKREGGGNVEREVFNFVFGETDGECSDDKFIDKSYDNWNGIYFENYGVRCV